MCCAVPARTGHRDEQIRERDAVASAGHKGLRGACGHSRFVDEGEPRGVEQGALDALQLVDRSAASAGKRLGGGLDLGRDRDRIVDDTGIDAALLERTRPRIGGLQRDPRRGDDREEQEAAESFHGMIVTREVRP